MRNKVIQVIARNLGKRAANLKMEHKGKVSRVQLRSGESLEISFKVPTTFTSNGPRVCLELTTAQ